MLVFFVKTANSQHFINLKLDTLTNSIQIKQKYYFINTADKPLGKIYLHAWANAYKTKTTALAKRFEENYSRSFHLAKQKDRGAITIEFIKALKGKSIKSYRFLKDSIDILEVLLSEPLKPADTLALSCSSTVKLPNAKFTKYGFDKEKNYYLRNWYLVPALVENNTFQLMNNKGLNDLWEQQDTYFVTLAIPDNYTVISDLQQQNAEFYGKNKTDIQFEFIKKSNYKEFQFDGLTIYSNIFKTKQKLLDRTLQLERIKAFLESKLGQYPFNKIVLSKRDYNLNPVFGVNQLPSFINPYPTNFEWDLKILKIYLQQYFDNVLLVNRRNDYQFIKGIQSYLMMEYVKEHYPNTKMLGKLSKIWGIRSFEIAKLAYNDKYWLYYQYIARKALDQSLKTPIDSLSNYNRNVANPFKAALGLRYLAAYTSDSLVQKSIFNYYNNNQFKTSSTVDFIAELKKQSTKNLDWFFEEYTQSNADINYKIYKVKPLGDSLQVIIRNKRKIAVPIAIYGIKKDSIVFKKWLPKILSQDTITIPNGDFNRLVLNYENLYPEINQRDNWKRVNNKVLLNKPLKIGVIEDVENPFYNQLFIIPHSDYNYYDGFLLGAKISNKTFLNKNFYFDVKPFFGLTSKRMTGSGNIFYKKLFQNRKLKSYRLGIGFSYYHFDANLSYRKFTPYIQFVFRDTNYRLSKQRALTINQTRLNKDDNGLNPFGIEAIKYNVLNFSYVHNEPGEIRRFTTISNLQISEKFAKTAFDIRYKKLTLGNRQWDLRAYAGLFLYNKSTSGYYDFALDRPTDYLFQYGYFGRSETTGILSQQYFIAEGGFKSRFVSANANQWLATTNMSTSIWKWIELYGDAGLLKNKGLKTKFYYDSGIRLNLVPGQFEAYFPLYSTNGFEPNQAQYATKIRLVFTTDLGRLIRFYKRGWH